MKKIITNKWSNDYKKGDKSEIGNIVSIVVDKEVKTGTTSRKPINLSIAIDVSISMGEPVGQVKRYAGSFDKTSQPLNQRFNNIRSPFNGLHPNSYQNLRDSLEDYKCSYVCRLDLVKEAAIKALDLLKEGDTVSIVTFDNVANVLAVNVPISNKDILKDILKQIRLGNSTNLFEGWRQAACCVTESMKEGSTNRVLLLSDGETNTGIVNPEQIKEFVKTLTFQGISTSTFGVGDHYNEELLQGIADAGDGNFYYLKDSKDFEEMFTDEFNMVMSVYGKNVTLKYTETGFEKVEFLNDFIKEDDEYKLPNISTLREISIGFNTIPKSKKACINITLSYDDASGQRQSIEHKVKVIPHIEDQDLKNQDVIDKINNFKSAILRKEAIKSYDNGDRESALGMLNKISAISASSSIGNREILLSSTNSLTQSLKSNDGNLFRKQAFYENYNTRNSKSR